MYICKFHDQYDGLIGNNILRQFKAKIDLENNKLIMGQNEIRIHFETSNDQICFFAKMGTYEVNIPIIHQEGLVYSPEVFSDNKDLKINEGIYNVSDYKMIALVEKLNDIPIKVKFDCQETTKLTEENFYVTEETNNKPLLEKIRMSHLNAEESSKLIHLVKRFSKIFYEENVDLTFTNAIRHQIRTTDHPPIAVKTYRYPYVHKSEVQKQIKEMLDKKIIRPSCSPYSAPVWVVPKKLDASGEKKWRLVIDYRKLNDVTIDDKYPIPNIDEILEKLGRCQYFTTVDLAKGFHQIEISEEDIHKTAFSVEGGHYEFLRMPFGLKTAPATFQRMINNVLSDYINNICLVYMDDIIIFSTSLQEHVESITKIFQRLKDVNLKVQLDKCEFLKRETEFLGHIVTETGIRPNPEKISCVKKFPLPKSAKEIKQFMGLTGYYRKFIRDYSKIAKPMTKYLKKDMKIDIDDPEYINSFETLKTLLTNDPILRYPDLSKIFTLTTDASNFALGAILSQEGHPICYASRTLNGHEQNYSTIEKELLAIIWATQYFRPYLFGKKFIIETDHRPLTWLFSIKEPNSKLVRWRLKLSEYDYEIRYKRGVKNGNADALSRIIINHGEIENSIILESECPINIYKRQYLIKQTPSRSLKIKNTNIFKSSRKTFYIKELKEDSIITIIKNHFEDGTNAVFIENEVFHQEFVKIAEKHFDNKSNKFKIIMCKKFLEDIVDEEKLADLIEKEHLKNNHRGINENYNELRDKIYHPNLKIRITEFINNCEICNLEKYDRRPVKQTFKATETPSKPREIVHADVFYSLNKTLFLTCIDKFSKHAQAIKIGNRSWVEFKRAITQYISSIGHFEKLTVDNELGFKALPLREFLRNQNIEIHFTSNNNHTSNSDIERLHNTINEHLRILRHDPNVNIDTVEEKILKIISFYNNTIHSTTGKKPIDFVHGKINQNEYPEIKERMVALKEKTINKLNQNREEVDIQTGNQFLKEVRGGKNHAKFRKVKVERLDNEHVITNTGHKYYKSHLKRAKKYQNNREKSD